MNEQKTDIFGEIDGSRGSDEIADYYDIYDEKKFDGDVEQLGSGLVFFQKF